MSERFFDSKTQADALAVFTQRFAVAYASQLPEFLDSAHGAVQSQVLQKPGTPSDFTWLLPSRSTQGTEFITTLAKHFWRQLTADERLPFFWGLSYLTPALPHETDVFVKLSTPWGTPDENPPRGLEQQASWKSFLAALADMPSERSDDLDLRLRVERNHTARAILSELRHSRPHLREFERERLWRVLWLRDVCDRSVHPLYDDADRFPRMAGRDVRELLSIHSTECEAVEQHVRDHPHITYENFYKGTLQRAARGMAAALVEAARVVNGYKARDMSAWGSTYWMREASSDTLPPSEHVELWVMLGRYPALLFRSGVLLTEGKVRVKALRLVQFASAPRVWPKGDREAYQLLLTRAINLLRAAQRHAMPADLIEWGEVEDVFSIVFQGLLYADPASCVYVRGQHGVWRTSLSISYARSQPKYLIPVRPSFYNVNAIDERREWAISDEKARKASGRTRVSPTPYDAYDVDQLKRMADEERQRTQRLTPPQQAQEIPDTPPFDLESDEVEEDSETRLRHAKRTLERQQRGMGRGGGSSDKSLFDHDADTWNVVDLMEED